MHPRNPAARPPVSTRVLTAVRGGVGEIVLNRPDALNAIDGEMFASIERTLLAWRDDPSVRLVLARGNGKAFSAGGDIRAVRDAVLRGDAEHNEALYRAEYAVDALVAEFPKPYVALIDGYAMGGGLGLAMHGSHRIVTERAIVAMPETLIGFFPDVGASYVFPRLPGELGMYLGLTGERLDDGGALTATLATHAIAHDDLSAFADAVRERPDALDGALARFERRPAHDTIAAIRAAIDRCFHANSLAGIIERLRADGSAWAHEVLAKLEERSPTALAVTFALFRLGATMTLRECLNAELRLGRTMLRFPDFIEGVRAAVVDKDRRPRWSPARLDDVDEAALSRIVHDAAYGKD